MKRKMFYKERQENIWRDSVEIRNQARVHLGIENIGFPLILSVEDGIHFQLFHFVGVRMENDDLKFMLLTE